MPACGSCPRAASADGWSARRRWGFPWWCAGGTGRGASSASDNGRDLYSASPAGGRGIGRAAPCTRLKQRQQQQQQQKRVSWEMAGWVRRQGTP
ncbi:hypothetical protein D7U87_12755 [Stenotrophomonas maltophilia]|nr:hypothetical protein [Stenotrophomonas maltophilia]MBA0458109.1 hypothetical protein [Stenotrophomonas maltophilia]